MTLAEYEHEMVEWHAMREEYRAIDARGAELMAQWMFQGHKLRDARRSLELQGLLATLPKRKGGA